MKKIVLACFLAFSTISFMTQTANATTITLAESRIATHLAKISETSLVPLRRHRRSTDLFDITRGLIQNVVTSLNNAATTATTSLRGLVDQVDVQKTQFLQNLNVSLTGLDNSIQMALEAAINNAQIILISIFECTDQQQVIAERLVSGTIANITQCINNTAGSFLSATQGATQLINSAIAAATDIVNQTQACGIADLQNFLTVGECLNRVLETAQTRANRLVADLVTVSTHAVTSVASAPLNFGICGASKITAATIGAARIIIEIGQCASGAIAGIQ